jgi:hypothetical protein
MQNKVKKMRNTKATFAVVFVTLLIALPMTLRTVSAYTDDRDGISFSFSTSYPNGYPNLPTYMECCHTNEHGTDDMMVGIGVYTKYGSDEKYNYANYWYTQQAGYGSSKTVSYVQPMGMYVDFDYGLSTASRSISYNYDSGSWINSYTYYFDGHPLPSGTLNWIYYKAQVIESTSIDRNSAEGMTQGKFINDNDPSTVYYRYAQTQVPPGTYVPSGAITCSYAFLTAHHTGDWQP